MGDTEQPVRRPGPADECLAMSTLWEKYYRPLVRLAALLTGDPGAAEAVVCDVLAALRPRPPIDPDPSEEVLLYLQQRVLARTRRIRWPGAASAGNGRGRCGGQDSVQIDAQAPGLAGRPAATDFASLPIVRALQELPRRGREAVVLTHYLDLSEHEAALVAGVPPTALHRSLSAAMRVLEDRRRDA
jgi:DNA-directed RNA polymerase specialized sigma24 family protein